MNTFKKIGFCFLMVASNPLVYGQGPGSSVGQFLLDAPSARSAALAEAMAADSLDIAAFDYNPSSLATLREKQASFLFHEGLSDDKQGHVMVGGPIKGGSAALSVRYFDGGILKLTDSGGNERALQAQRDLSISMGSAKTIGHFMFGLTGKYISSTLAEQYQAHAYAADLGMQVELTKNFRFGIAAQNMGTILRYAGENEELPKIARVGWAWALPRFSSSINLDSMYLMNERELRSALGWELKLGPLALRTGHISGGGFQSFSLGMGLALGDGSFDYSQHLISGLDNQQRISFSLKFGKPKFNNIITKLPIPPNTITEKNVLVIDPNENPLEANHKDDQP